MSAASLGLIIITGSLAISIVGAIVSFAAARVAARYDRRHDDDC